MTAEKCLEMLREIKDAAFATVDQNGRPQVRIIDVMLAEDRALYFCTSRGKDFYHQLIDKKETAIVGMNEKYQTVRLNSKIEKLKDQKYWIDRIFEEKIHKKTVQLLQIVDLLQKLLLAIIEPNELRRILCRF